MKNRIGIIILIAYQLLFVFSNAIIGVIEYFRFKSRKFIEIDQKQFYFVKAGQAISIVISIFVSIFASCLKHKYDQFERLGSLLRN